MNSEIKKHTVEIRNKHNAKLGDCLIAATPVYAGFPFITADKGFKKITELNHLFYNLIRE
jgi:predicted nucleic acid-binding protein